MDWEDLRVALAIARSGGLAGAARGLKVNHATVWRRLKALEAELDTRLFERRPEGYVPTAAGDELRRAAEAMEEAADGLDRRLSGRDARLTGTVRLSTLDPVAMGLLPPHLARFRELHPGILIELAVSSALANLTRRDADIVLRATEAPPETLVGQRLADVAMAAYAAPAYLARNAAGTDWARHDWIAPDEIFAHTPFYRFIAREGGGRAVLRADSEPALAAAAAAGIGATLLPCFVGDADPRLVRLSPPLPELTHGLWLLTHEDLRGAARIRAVLDFLSVAIRSERARLAGVRP
jgi:DNA-binding transcriptional LysR family regulator